ncbi:MAG: tRNA pseudouridine(38-40) synthase TruA [Desulfobacteraceae bacterium]|nr:tRNA pseudouridine(38-40) synthase TruA [Desulfobacteraceae bacterium]
MRNIRLTIQYSGLRYHGWQRQKDKPTIQWLIESAINKMTGERIALTGSGRTDAGVNAIAQVANFHTASAIPVIGIQKGLNSLLPHDIAITSAEDVDEGFHAARDSLCKIYSYHMVSFRLRLPLWEERAWVINRDLDEASISSALPYLVKRQDFSAFRASGSNVRTSVRTVFHADFRPAPPGQFPPSGARHYIFTIAADGFLRYMVRNIVGVLFLIGTGRLAYYDMERILASRRRSLAGPTAPPQGLYLERVFYDELEPGFPV